MRPRVLRTQMKSGSGSRSFTVITSLSATHMKDQHNKLTSAKTELWHIPVLTRLGSWTHSLTNSPVLCPLFFLFSLSLWFCCWLWCRNERRRRNTGRRPSSHISHISHVCLQLFSFSCFETWNPDFIKPSDLDPLLDLKDEVTHEAKTAWKHEDTWGYVYCLCAGAWQSIFRATGAHNTNVD